MARWKWKHLAKGQPEASDSSQAKMMPNRRRACWQALFWAAVLTTVASVAVSAFWVISAGPPQDAINRLERIQLGMSRDDVETILQAPGVDGFVIMSGGCSCRALDTSLRGTIGIFALFLAKPIK
jgi:hypothetical protein